MGLVTHDNWIQALVEVSKKVMTIGLVLVTFTLGFGCYDTADWPIEAHVLSVNHKKTTLKRY